MDNIDNIWGSDKWKNKGIFYLEPSYRRMSRVLWGGAIRSGYDGCVIRSAYSKKIW